MDGWMDDGWMEGWLDRWVDVDGWLDDRWMDGWSSRTLLCGAAPTSSTPPILRGLSCRHGNSIWRPASGLTPPPPSRWPYFPTLQQPITTASWSNLAALERFGFPGLPCFSVFPVFFCVFRIFQFFRVSCVKPTTQRIGSQSQRVVCLLESESRRSNSNDVVVLVAPQRSAGGKKLLFFPRKRRNATLSSSLTFFLRLRIVRTPSGTRTFWALKTWMLPSPQLPVELCRDLTRGTSSNRRRCPLLVRRAPAQLHLCDVPGFVVPSLFGFLCSRFFTLIL